MTNLELTTGASVPGRIQKSNSTEKYVLYFKGGIEGIVSGENKERIEKAFDRYFDDGKDSRIKMKDGTVVLASTLLSIKPIRQDTSGGDALKKINKMLSEIPANNEKIKWWIQRINENNKRLEAGLPWIYYDKKGNTITRALSDVIFGRPAGVVLGEDNKII